MLPAHFYYPERAATLLLLGGTPPIKTNKQTNKQAKACCTQQHTHISLYTTITIMLMKRRDETRFLS
jgi:hypothetical protein